MDLPIVIADNHIPYLEALATLPLKLIPLKASEITRETLLKTGAKALLIRTRTRADRQLLEGTSIKFIGTATIGTDHIDMDWCTRQAIQVASAPGCNAKGVMQYVAAAIALYCEAQQLNPSQLNLGIIGYGNTGRGSSQVGQALDMHVLINDPPLADAGILKTNSPLSQVLSDADIITLHVPLTYSAPYPTYHLIHSKNINLLKTNCLLINTSRGGVVEEAALIEFKTKHPAFNYILDVWENEPQINPLVLKQAFIATPHIAGYSLDGKRKASLMIFNAFMDYLGWNININLPEIPPPTPSNLIAHRLTEAILQAYPIAQDDENLRQDYRKFEHLRSHYAFRHEFHHYRITHLPNGQKEQAYLLGFRMD